MERNDLEKREPHELAQLLRLADSERRYYEDIVAAIPVGLVVLSTDFSVLSANRSALEIFEVKAVDSLRSRLDGLEPGGIQGHVRDVLANGIPKECGVMFTKWNVGRQLRIRIQPLNRFSQSPLEALLTIEDVTGLRSEPNMQVRSGSPPDATAIIENLYPAVWVVAIPQMRFRYVNSAARALFGFDHLDSKAGGEFSNRSVYPADRERVGQVYRAVVAQPASFDRGIACEYRLVTQGNNTIWLYEMARIICDAGGRPQYLTGITIDVTQRRYLERQLVRSNRRHAVGRIAGKLAHDLNNLLMIVTGYGEELLGNVPPESPLRLDLEQILKAGERVAALTNQLTIFTRRQSDPTMTIDLNETLAGMLTSIRRILGEKIELKYEPTPHRIAISADPTHFQQMISTFARRSRELMPGGGIFAIEVKRTYITEDILGSDAPLGQGEYAIVAIQDDGPQYSEQARATLFEAFLVADRDLQDIGSQLSRVYGLVRQWGGDISVEAGPTEGELFQIFLPMVADPGHASVVVGERTTVSRSKTILVVDDEEGIRQMIGKILRHRGFKVLEAKAGCQAIEVFRAQHQEVSLVIADVSMPDMDGPMLIEQLRTFQNELKVLYISGYTADANLCEENLAPGTAFLRKPFTLAALQEKVKEMTATTQQQ
jgi:PAS domain S-box-containing protein